MLVAARAGVATATRRWGAASLCRYGPVAPSAQKLRPAARPWARLFSTAAGASRDPADSGPTVQPLPVGARREVTREEASTQSTSFPATMRDYGDNEHLRRPSPAGAPYPRLGRLFNFLIGRARPSVYCNNTENLDKENLEVEFSRQLDYLKYEEWKKTQYTGVDRSMPGRVLHRPPAVEAAEAGGGGEIPPRTQLRSELYGLKIYNTQGPRDHLAVEGLKAGGTFVWNHTHRDAQPQKFVSVDGQTYILGVPTLPHDEMHWMAHRNDRWYAGIVNKEYHPRLKLKVFTNYDFIMKTDYALFWLPAFIVLSLTVPAFCLAYLIDELAYTSMTVKVIARQWYWVYEVESPTDDEEDDAAAEEEDEEKEDGNVQPATVFR